MMKSTVFVSTIIIFIASFSLQRQCVSDQLDFEQNSAVPVDVVRYTEPMPLQWQCVFDLSKQNSTVPVVRYTEPMPLQWQCVLNHSELNSMVPVVRYTEPMPLQRQCVSDQFDENSSVVCYTEPLAMPVLAPATQTQYFCLPISCDISILKLNLDLGLHNFTFSNDFVDMSGYYSPEHFEPNFVFYMQIPTHPVALSFSLFPADLKTLLGKRNQNTTSLKKTVLVYICMLYILHAGDTETNPGPEFPCKICNEECDWSRYAVQCDSCDAWYHADCMHMSSEIYASLEDSNVTWICCDCGLPNFASSLFSSHVTVLTNSFNTLSTVSNEDDDSPPPAPMATSSPQHVNPNRNCDSFSGKRKKWSQKPTNFNRTKTERNSQLKVMVINFQSIRNKVADLAICLNTNKPDILIGTESWLSDGVSNSEIFPSDYSVIRKDRPTNKHGKSYGGIFIAMKNDLVANHRSDLDEECEILWLQFELAGSKSILVGAFYRPPDSDSDVLNLLRNSLSKINLTKRQNIWIGGDFNLSHIDWANQTTIPNCPKPGLCRELLDICNDFGLEQVVTEPTRDTNLLDLFFTSNSTLVEKSTIIPGISDHTGIPVIVMNTKPKLNRSKPRKVFLYSKADWEQIKQDLSEISNDFVNMENNSATVEELWADFSTRITKSVANNVPSRMVSPGKTIPWCDFKVKKALRQKKKAFNRARKSDSEEDWSKFRSIRKSVNKLTRSNYRKYIRETCAESTKKFWSFIKSLKTDSFGISTLRHNGILVSDNAKKAEVLNSQFKSVFTDEDVDTLPNLGLGYPSIPNIDITVNGIMKLLKGLNPNKATGPDDIPARILKICAPEIAPALTVIFRKSLETGTLPQDWKRANVSPIFKKGERSNPSNYRPVSLTSVCCKVMEHVIHTNIMSHFEHYDILSDKQHGFRRNHSCESQLILTTYDLSKTLDKRLQSDVIIMDFHKAFDVVPHQRLMLKLDHYGIRGQMKNWIEDFLMSRKQRVVIGGEHSDWIEVKSGVPQGTVLGPLLFLTYINDLPDNISSTVRLFADDCVIYRSITTDKDAEILQKDLDQLSLWEKKWQMKFNLNKCFVLKVTNARKPKSHSYILNNTKLTETDSHTYLGVELSKNLKWNKHVDRVTAKSNRTLGFIKRNLNKCTEDIKSLAYCSLVRPSLEYCSSVWDPHTNDLISQVEAVQRRAARFVKNDYGRLSSVSSMLKELGWSTLAERRRIARLTTFFKAHEGYLSIPVRDLLHPVTRLTRRSHNKSYIEISTNKDSFKYSFLPRTLTDWNSLPGNLVNTQDPKSFKAKLQQHYQ